MSGPPPTPDDKRLFLLLRETGLSEDEAYTFVQELGDMAAANLIARFESKLDAQNAKLDSHLEAQNSRLDAQNAKLDAHLGAQNSRLDTMNAKLDARLGAQNSKLDTLRWLTGAGLAAIGILVALVRAID